MDVTVRTGQTKTARGVTPVALSLASAHDEKVCFLMEIHGDQQDAAQLEQECATVVRHALLETEGEAAARLDSTLKELNGLLKGMLLTGAVKEVHMLLAIMERDGVLHVSHAGRSEAYLVRHGTASQVTEYVGGRPTPAFVHIATGETEPKDVVIFSTQRLLRSLTPVQLAAHAQHERDVVPELLRALEAEGECAAVGAFFTASKTGRKAPATDVGDDLPPARPASRQRGRATSARASVDRLTGVAGPMAAKGVKAASDAVRTLASSDWLRRCRERWSVFVADLAHPKRKKRAHLLLLAAAIATLLIIWAVAHLFTSSQRSKTKAELEQLVVQIEDQLKTAENRRIIGDTDSANAILQQAEERAKQVRDNESGLYRAEALELLGRIVSKREELNNILRVTSPRVVANISAKESSVELNGIIGLNDGEFLAYDDDGFFRVLLNSVDSQTRVSDGERIVDGVAFPRYQSVLFLTSGNSVVEVTSGQITPMKTDDTDGWVDAVDLETYQRNVYFLAADQAKIFKYERLNNRFGQRVQYNVAGDLQGAIDMSIDGNIYVLKEDGSVMNFYRGEVQPFSIKRLPPDALKGAYKIVKQTKNFYFLAPARPGDAAGTSGGRVVVATDGGPTGESTYVRQYVLEGEQIGTLTDLYVDPDESRLYVADEKHIYVVDLAAK